jgi:sugar O-acyltransferase (sialic acid O-acetyltransferase NeuD family)
MRKKPIQVIGAGGHAKVVVRTLLELGYAVQAIFDDDARRWGTQLLGCPIRGPVERIETNSRIPAIIAIGDNSRRQAIAERYRLSWATVVHPSAFVDPTVELGAGSVVLHRAVLQTDCRIGNHAIVNTAATVDHDCVVGDYAHLAPGTHLAGAVTIGDRVLLGIGAVVAPGERIGEGTVVGAGAAVASDLPPGVVACGVPARVTRMRFPNSEAPAPWDQPRMPLRSA